MSIHIRNENKRRVTVTCLTTGKALEVWTASIDGEIDVWASTEWFSGETSIISYTLEEYGKSLIKVLLDGEERLLYVYHIGADVGWKRYSLNRVDDATGTLYLCHPGTLNDTWHEDLWHEFLGIMKTDKNNRNFQVVLSGFNLWRSIVRPFFYGAVSRPFQKRISIYVKVNILGLRLTLPVHKV